MGNKDLAEPAMSLTIGRFITFRIRNETTIHVICGTLVTALFFATVLLLVAQNLLRLWLNHQVA